MLIAAANGVSYGQDPRTKAFIWMSPALVMAAMKECREVNKKWTEMMNKFIDKRSEIHNNYDVTLLQMNIVKVLKKAKITNIQEVMDTATKLGCGFMVQTLGKLKDGDGANIGGGLVEEIGSSLDGDLGINDDNAIEFGDEFEAFEYQQNHNHNDNHNHNRRAMVMAVDGDSDDEAEANDDENVNNDNHNHNRRHDKEENEN